MNSLSNQFERKAWKIQDRLQPEMEQRSLSLPLSLHPFLLLHPCNYLAAEAAAANEQAFWLWNFHLFTSIRRVEEKKCVPKMPKPIEFHANKVFVCSAAATSNECTADSVFHIASLHLHSHWVCVCVVYASRRVTLVIDDTENPPNRIEEA